MPILEPNEFKSFFLAPAPLLGLDVGSKTIGLAVCDPNWVVASPLDVLHRNKFSIDVETLAHIYSERSVGGLVIGLPLNHEGTDGPRAQSTRAFARNLIKNQNFIDTPVTFWDERFSTQIVEQMMINELDLSRKKRQGDKDKLAAALILQGFLDSN